MIINDDPFFMQEFKNEKAPPQKDDSQISDDSFFYDEPGQAPAEEAKDSFFEMEEEEVIAKPVVNLSRHQKFLV
jgi:hypothetical protein